MLSKPTVLLLLNLTDELLNSIDELVKTASPVTFKLLDMSRLVALISCSML